MTTPQRNHIDLHCHTARSDGVLEPEELYRQMRAWGSTLVSITDHDTLAGVRELLTSGLGRDEADGPRLLPGVEINTRVDDEIGAVGGSAERIGELHILGLGIDTDDPSFEATLARQRDGRRRRMELTLERLDELSIDVRGHLPRPAGGIESLGRPHIARALVAAGYAETVDGAFRRFLEPGAAAYVRREGIGPRQAIEAIVGAGGIAALAHAAWAPDEPAVIEQLERWGMRAIEVHYHRFDDETASAMSRFARQRGLLATGGSDYHGDGVDYATAQATTHVPDEVGERLLETIDGMDG